MSRIIECRSESGDSFEIKLSERQYEELFGDCKTEEEIAKRIEEFYIYGNRLKNNEDKFLKFRVRLSMLYGKYEMLTEDIIDAVNDFFTKKKKKRD